MRSRLSLLVPMLTVVCLVVVGCKTEGTTREQDDGAAAPGAGSVLQMPLTGRLAAQTRTVGYSRDQRPETYARAGSAAARSAAGTEERSAAAVARELTPMRALLLGGVPIIFAGALGAIGTSFDGRRKRGTPSSRARE